MSTGSFRAGCAGLALGAAALVGAAACGRSQGIPDEELGGLVLEARAEARPIDVAKAARDPGELGRALARPHAHAVAAFGPHVLTVTGTSAVSEGTTALTELAEKAVLELGEDGAFHAVYTNSGDYGREVTFVGGTLYLRPRYQRWHGRPPEAEDEPARLRDGFAEPIAATWDLLAPGAELSDKGAGTVAGRAARTIAVQLAPRPAPNPPERLRQRAWRAGRVVEAVSGTIALDAASGAPLSVDLSGTVAFTRDGRRFRITTSVTATIADLGKAAAIAPPDPAEVVATPERLREVDERDQLLEGIAPPARKRADAAEGEGPGGGGAAPPAAAPAGDAP